MHVNGVSLESKASRADPVGRLVDGDRSKSQSAISSGDIQSKNPSLAKTTYAGPVVWCRRLIVCTVGLAVMYGVKSLYMRKQKNGMDGSF